MRQLIATLALIVMPALAHADDPLVGDALEGQQYAARCIASHSVTDSANKIGPSLVGVFGRQTATPPGFTYSTQDGRAGQQDGVCRHRRCSRPRRPHLLSENPQIALFSARREPRLTFGRCGAKVENFATLP